MVCDDYGSVRWPGAGTAVDNFCSASNVPLLRLASGQAMIFGPRVA